MSLDHQNRVETIALRLALTVIRAIIVMISIECISPVLEENRSVTLSKSHESVGVGHSESDLLIVLHHYEGLVHRGKEHSLLLVKNADTELLSSLHCH